MDGYITAYRLEDGKNVFFGLENTLKNGYHFVDGVINDNELVYTSNDPQFYEIGRAHV